MSFKSEQYEWKNRELNSIAELLKKIDLTTSGQNIEGLTKNLIEAIESSLKLINANEILADLAIANLPLNKYYLNHAKCFVYLYKSAENGYAPAQYEIACQADSKKLFPPHQNFEDERWVDDWFSDKNEQERNAFQKSEYDHWLRLAAENNYADAQYQLSTDLFNSDNTANTNEALLWLAKAAYNRTPLPPAQFEYAKRIENGEYQYKPNQEDIFHLYEKAALGGDADAMLRMGKFYEEGNEGVAQDNEEAVRWYELSIENYAKEYYLDEEIHLGEAHLRAGKLMLELDKKSDKYWHKAINHLKEAGEAGIVEAMYIVGTELVKSAVRGGVAYAEASYDDHLRRTFSEGASWLSRASEHNSIDALDELANLYDSGDIGFGLYPDCGDGEYENLLVALRLYEKAHDIEPNDYYPKAISRIQDKLQALSDE